MTHDAVFTDLHDAGPPVGAKDKADGFCNEVIELPAFPGIGDRLAVRAR
jgi:hypothetical protein